MSAPKTQKQVLFKRLDAEATGRDSLSLRSDYQAALVIKERTELKKSEPHDLKIARYRDQLMGLLSQTPMPERLFELMDSRSSVLLDKPANNTELAIYSDFIQYVKYCLKLKVAALPFQDFNVDAYLSHLMAAGRKRSTIDRHLASLVRWADILELDDPRQFFKVKARLLEIRKKVKSRPRQAEGLRAHHLTEALEKFDPNVPRDGQDIALLFIGFETLGRQSEIVAFDWADFEQCVDNSGLMHLENSKTDQDGEGEVLYLSPNTVSLLLRWKAVSNPDNKAGPIFRGIYSDGAMGDRLSTKGVRRCFKRIAKRLELDSALFSGHSTRVGAAQEMIERNIDSAKVMISGRWKSMAMLTRYSKKITAKRSGIADLTKALGWQEDIAIEHQTDSSE